MTLVASSLVAHAHAEQSTSFLKGSVYETVGLTENVDPLLLYSISLVESAKASKQNNISLVTPHKFVIRTPDGPVYPTTFRNAKKWLSYCIRKYDKKQLDVGLTETAPKIGLVARFNFGLSARFNFGLIA